MAVDEEAELLSEFRIESLEHLEELEPLLLDIDTAQGEERTELVNRIFRAVHSIKGVAGFFDLDIIESLSHAMESTLMPIRDGLLDCNAEMVDVLLHSGDVLRRLVEALPVRAVIDCSANVAQLKALTDSSGATKEGTPDVQETPNPVDQTSGTSDGEENSALTASSSEITAAQASGKRLYIFENKMKAGRAFVEEVAKILKAVGDTWLIASVLEIDLLAKAIEVEMTQLRELKPPKSAKGTVTSTIGPDTKSPSGDAAETSTLQITKSSDIHPTATMGASPVQVRQQETIRVSVDLLNKLMNLSGELVLARNQMTNQFSGSDDPRADAILQTLDSLTSELQANIMLTRMQRLGAMIKKLPRVVRDLAKKLGKEVEFQLNGEDVELDKGIIESLADPLTHMVRNALDHGIELPAERTALGKPPCGVLRLDAFHEAGQVIIQISDDGAGIDPHTMRTAAVRKGLMSADEAAALSDSAAQMLIFSAGFSTAAKVTDVSGRGVGMDVVRVNINKLGGKVNLRSKVGEGTNLRIQLPLTLATISSLLVRLGDERFAIPQVSLVELVRIAPKNADNLVQDVSGMPALGLRGKLVPLVALRSVLFGTSLTTEDLQSANKVQFVVILRIGTHRLGLIVDSVDDTEEIVVKPLSPHLKSCGVYAGATLMGDGHVAMILEANAIAAVACIDYETTASESAKIARSSLQPLLVFEAGSERFAAPVEHFARVDRIVSANIQTVGDRELIHSRDEIIELQRLDSLIPSQGFELDEYSYILVAKQARKGVGILVSRLVDTIDFTWPSPASGAEGAVLSQETIAGEITTMLLLSRLWEDSSAEPVENRSAA